MKKGKPQEKEEAYEVGYGKPPTHSRFRPGRSGNPKGRPKGTKNLKTDLIEELGEKILVREGEQARQVSKQRAVVKTLMARALKGDTRAASLLLSMMMRLIDTGEGGESQDEPLQENDLAILRDYEARVRQHDAKAPARSGKRSTRRRARRRQEGSES
jgi:hypothetical protein